VVVAMVKTPRGRSGAWVYVAAAIVIGGIVAALLRYELAHDALSVAVVSEFKEPEKTVVQMILDLSKTFTAWAIALIGAIAIFINKAIEKPGTLTRTQLILAFIAIIGAVASVFLGQLAAERVYLLIIDQQSPTKDMGLFAFLKAQYLAGIGALAMFAFVLFYAAWRRTTHGGH
jgi:hypothetical protein